jgi:multidrug efflux pump subunit AcrA (membrane-fusion protein)
MRGKWILAAGIVIFVSAGIGAWTLWRKQSAPQPKQAVAAEAPPGTEVRLSGTIRAVYLIQLAAPIDGVTEEFAVKPGDEVFEGQILGRIASETLQESERETALEAERAVARLNQLESELITARLDESRLSADLSRSRGETQRLERAFARQQLLMKEGATARKTFEKSSEEFTAAKSESENLDALARQATERIAQALRDIEAAKKAVEEKQAAHDAAKTDLAAADILAPVDGVITAIKKGAGEQVQKTMPDLIEMSPDLSVLEIVLEPDPKTIKRIKAGQPAAVLLAETNAPLECPVKSVDGQKIVIEFSSPSAGVRPGATATVTLRLN